MFNYEKARRNEIPGSEAPSNTLRVRALVRSPHPHRPQLAEAGTRSRAGSCGSARTKPPREPAARPSRGRRWSEAPLTRSGPKAEHEGGLDTGVQSTTNSGPATSPPVYTVTCQMTQRLPLRGLAPCLPLSCPFLSPVSSLLSFPPHSFSLIPSHLAFPPPPFISIIFSTAKQCQLVFRRPLSA